MVRNNPTQTKTSASIMDIAAIANQPEVIELTNKKQSRKRKSQSPNALYRNLMIINEEQEDEKYLITYNSGNRKLKTKEEIIQKVDETFHVFKESQREESKYRIIAGHEDKKMDKCESILIKFYKKTLPPSIPNIPIPEVVVMEPDEGKGKEISASELSVEESSQAFISPSPSTSTAKTDANLIQDPLCSSEKVVFNTPPSSPSPSFP